MNNRGHEGNILPLQKEGGPRIEPRVKDIRVKEYIDRWNEEFANASVQAEEQEWLEYRIEKDTEADIQPVEKLENSMLSYIRRVYPGKFSNEELHERFMILRKLLPKEQLQQNSAGLKQKRA